MKTSYFTHGCWVRPISYFLDLLFINFNSIGGNHKTQKYNFVGAKIAFGKVGIKLCIAKSQQNLRKMGNVFIQRFAINQDIIEINPTNLPMKTLKTSFIRRMKVEGALERPKGITSHSYNPSFILQAVFHSSPVLMRI